MGGGTVGSGWWVVGRGSWVMGRGKWVVGSTFAPTLGIGRSATKEMGFASSGAMSTAVLGEKLWAV